MLIDFPDLEVYHIMENFFNLNAVVGSWKSGTKYQRSHREYILYGFGDTPIFNIFECLIVKFTFDRE